MKRNMRGEVLEEEFEGCGYVERNMKRRMVEEEYNRQGL